MAINNPQPEGRAMMTVEIATAYFTTTHQVPEDMISALDCIADYGIKELWMQADYAREWAMDCMEHGATTLILDEAAV